MNRMTNLNRLKSIAGQHFLPTNPPSDNKDNATLAWNGAKSHSRANSYRRLGLFPGNFIPVTFRSRDSIIARLVALSAKSKPRRLPAPARLLRLVLLPSLDLRLLPKQEPRMSQMQRIHRDQHHGTLQSNKLPLIPNLRRTPPASQLIDPVSTSDPDENRRHREKDRKDLQLPARRVPQLEARLPMLLPRPPAILERQQDEQRHARDLERQPRNHDVRPRAGIIPILARHARHPAARALQRQADEVARDEDLRVRARLEAARARADGAHDVREREVDGGGEEGRR